MSNKKHYFRNPWHKLDPLDLNGHVEKSNFEIQGENKEDKAEQKSTNDYRSTYGDSESVYTVSENLTSLKDEDFDKQTNSSKLEVTLPEEDYLKPTERGSSESFVTESSSSSIGIEAQLRIESTTLGNRIDIDNQTNSSLEVTLADSLRNWQSPSISIEEDSSRSLSAERESSRTFSSIGIEVPKESG